MTTPLTLFTARNDGTLQLWQTDGDTQVLLASGLRTQPVVADGIAYFTTWEGVFRSDGTVAGTQQLRAGEGQLAAVGSEIWLLAGPTPMDLNVYRLQDATFVQVSGDTDDAGNPRWDPSGIGGLIDPVALVATGDQLFLRANSQPGPMLMRWDGTLGMWVDQTFLTPGFQALPGTHTLYFTDPSALYAADASGVHWAASLPNNGFSLEMVVLGDAVYYTREPEFQTMSSGRELFVFDAARGVPLQVTFAQMPPEWWMPAHGNDVANLRAVDNTLFFTQNINAPGMPGPIGVQLVKLVGMDAFNPGQVVALTGPGTGLSVGNAPATTSFEGELFFFAQADDGSTVLARSGQSFSGAEVVATLPADTYGSATLQVTRIGDDWFFAASDAHGMQLFKAGDGGTAQLVSAGSGGFVSMSDFTVVDGKLLFNADDGAHGKELWVSDGTSAGTVLAQDLDTGTHPDVAFMPRDYAADADGLFYTLTDARGHTELWKSDAGGAAARVTLPEGVTGLWDAIDSDGSGVYFTALDPGGARCLFYVNAEGFTQLSHAGDPWLVPGYGAGTDGAFYTSGVGSDALFRADGSGVQQVTATSGGAPLGAVKWLKAAGDSVILTAIDPSDGTVQLYRADGSQLTQLTHRPGGLPASLQAVEIVGNAVYVDMGDGAYKVEGGDVTDLGQTTWVSGGRPLMSSGDQTTIVHDGVAYAWNPTLIAAQATTPYPYLRDVEAVGNAVYWTMEEGSQLSLFRTQGASTTKLLGNGPNENARLGDPNLVVYDETVWSTNGNGQLVRADASAVTTFNHSASGEEFIYASNLRVAGDYLYFTAYSFSNQRELWRTDGTVAGTQRLTNTIGQNDGDPGDFFNVAGPESAGDNLAPVVAAAQSFAYAENQQPFAALGQVVATDNEGVTRFRFENGTDTSDDGFFKIANDGTLSLLPAAAATAANDFETPPNVFLLRVQAGDLAGNWGAATGVALHVTDVDDTAPVVAANQAIGYFERAAAGATLGYVAASDASGIAAMLFAGGASTSPDGFFSIAANGAVSLTAAGAASTANEFDLLPNSFTYGVQAIDGAGNQSASVDVNFTVRHALAVPVVTGLAAGSDTGRSASDGITRVTAPTLTGTGAASTSVYIYDGDNVLAIATVGASGAWSARLPLSTGSHQISVETHAGADASPRSSPYQLRIDNAAPAAPTVAAASDAGVLAARASTSDNTLLLSGAAEAGASVELFDNGVSLGSTLVAAGAWSLPAGSYASPLADGLHTFTARATDAAGNVSAAATFVATVDTQGPGVPSIAGLAAGNDTGLSGTDGVTRVASPVVTGSAEAGSTVRIFNDGSWVATAVASSTGSWSARLQIVDDGPHQVRAQAVDKAGNQGGFSDAFVVTVDRSTPPQPAFLVRSDSGQVPGGGYTQDTTLEVRTSGFAGTRLELFDAGVLLVRQDFLVDEAAVLAAGTAAAPLANGAHSLVVKITDLAGNSASSAPITVTVDALAPLAPMGLALAATSDTGRSSSDGITRLSSLRVTGTAEAGSTVRLFDSAAEVGSAVAGSTGTFSVVTTALDATSHSLVAQATDRAGNVGAFSAPLAVVVDQTAPLKAEINVLSDTGLLVSGATTADARLDLYGYVEADARVELFDGAVSLGSVPAPAGLWSIAAGSVLQPLAEGRHTLTVKATDIAGNTSSSNFVVTVKTQPPEVPTIAGLASASDTGVAGDGITRLLTPTLTGSADPRVTVRLYENDALLGTGSSDAAGNWSVRITSPLTYGEHSITATAVDAAGNESAGAASVVVLMDNLAPLRPSIGVGGEHGSLGSGGYTVDHVLQVDAFTEALVRVELLDNGSLVASGFTDVWGNAVLSTDAGGGLLAEGVHSLAVRATDDAGNVSLSAPIRAIVDSLAPDLPGFSGLTTATDTGASSTDGVTRTAQPTLAGTGEAGTTVHVYLGDYELGTTAVGSGGAWNYRLPGLGNGNHEISVEVVDRAGNASDRTDARMITIDTVAPTRPAVAVFDAHGTVANNATNVGSHLQVQVTTEANASVKLLDNGVARAPVLADASGLAVFELDGLTLGSHRLQATATDVAGNAASSSYFTLSMPNHAPVVSGPVTAVAREGSTAAALDALANASDPDPATVLAVVTNQPLPAGVSYDAAQHAWLLDTSNPAYRSLLPGQVTLVQVAYAVSDGTASTPAQAAWELHGAAKMDFSSLATPYVQEGLQVRSTSGLWSGPSESANLDWSYLRGDGSPDTGAWAGGLEPYEIAFQRTDGGHFGVDRIGTFVVDGTAVVVGVRDGAQVASAVVSGSGESGSLQLGADFADLTALQVYAALNASADAGFVGIDNLYCF